MADDLERLRRAKHHSRLRRMASHVYSDDSRDRLERLIGLRDHGHFAGSAISREASDEDLAWLFRILLQPCDWNLILDRARELAEFVAKEQAS